MATHSRQVAVAADFSAVEELHKRSPWRHPQCVRKPRTVHTNENVRRGRVPHLFSKRHLVAKVKGNALHVHARERSQAVFQLGLVEDVARA